MIIIGIDPATVSSGFGIIQVEGSSYTPIEYGTIRPSAKDKLSQRYLVLFNSVEQLIQKYQPDVLVVETQYVNKNAQSALKIGMARGSVIIAAAKNEVSIVEITPTKAKLAVVGNGRASKEQVQGMIRKLLGLAKPPQSDAADALALAICHAQSCNKPFLQVVEV